MPMINGSTRTDMIWDTGVVDMGFHWITPFHSDSYLAGWLSEGEMDELADLIPIDAAISVENYPNPFNPNTTIKLGLGCSGELELIVADISGRIVRTLYQGYIESGSHEFTFSAESLPSGVYFYRAKVEGFTATGKALLIK